MGFFLFFHQNLRSFLFSSHKLSFSQILFCLLPNPLHSIQIIAVLNFLAHIHVSVFLTARLFRFLSFYRLNLYYCHLDYLFSTHILLHNFSTHPFCTFSTFWVILSACYIYFLPFTSLSPFTVTLRIFAAQ